MTKTRISAKVREENLAEWLDRKARLQFKLLFVVAV